MTLGGGSKSGRHVISSHSFGEAHADGVHNLYINL